MSRTPEDNLRLMETTAAESMGELDAINRRAEALRASVEGAALQSLVSAILHMAHGLVDTHAGNQSGSMEMCHDQAIALRRLIGRYFDARSGSGKWTARDAYERLNQFVSEAADLVRTEGGTG